MIILCMLFAHIVDDYYLQGILAKLKQKSWWQENAPNSMYKYDYIVGLFMHSFSWTFMITLPFIITRTIDTLFILVFIINIIIHAYVDNLKCNKLKINLIEDQSIHIIQIIFTYIFLI